MDSLSQDKILKFNENTLFEVRKLFDLHRPGAMEEAVNILDAWVKQQQHFLMKDFDKNYLETTIIVSKGSIERAKERLDKACTLRTLMPHIFVVCDVKGYFKKELRHIIQAPLPQMTKYNERAFMMRNVAKSYDQGTHFRNWTQCLSMMADYLRYRDYAASYHAVFDLSQVNLMELLQIVTIDDLQELKAMILDCGGFRVSGIYVVCGSKLISVLIKMIKQLVSAKIADRIHVFNDFEPVYNILGDILPEEYGGKEKPLRELHDQWLDVVTSEEHCNYLRKMQQAITNEALRPKDVFNQQYLGLPGTFRTLNVD